MKALQLSEARETAIINTLRACQLFTGLGIVDLRRIAQVTVLKRLDKGEYLFREGDPVVGFYVVQRGTISVHRLGPGGREQVLHLFRAGDSLGEAVLGTQGGYPADARATEPTQVLLVQKNEFLSILRNNPELFLRILGSMSRRIRELVDMVCDLSLRDVEARLASWLLRRCTCPESKEPISILLPTTKRVLAAELGMASETLSRTFAKFRKHGLIEVQGRLVTVLAPSALAALVRNSESI